MTLKDIRQDLKSCRVSLGVSLNCLKEAGQCVTLNWGEDTQFWDACWITGGRRFRGVGRTPRHALMELLDQAAAALEV